MSGRPQRAAAAALAAAAVAGAQLAPFAPHALSLIAGIAGATALAALAAAGRLGALARTPAFLAVAALLAWMLLSGFWALVPANVYSTALGLAPLMLAGLSLAAVPAEFDAAAAARIGRAVVLAFILAALVLAIELVTAGALFRFLLELRGRPPGWFPAIASRGTVLMVLLAWPAALAMWRLGWRQPAAALPVAALAVAALGDHASSKVAAVAAIVVFAAVWRFGRPAALGLAGLFAALVLAAPLLPFGPLAPDLHAGWLGDIRYSGLHRLHIWRFTAERILEHPAIGWGLDAARSIPGGAAEIARGGTLMSLHPHNAPLQVWLELGAVGAALAAALLFAVGRAVAAMELDPVGRAVAAAALAAVMVFEVLSYGVWQTWWVGTIGLTAGWIAAAVRIRR